MFDRTGLHITDSRSSTETGILDASVDHPAPSDDLSADLSPEMDLGPDIFEPKPDVPKPDVLAPDLLTPDLPTPDLPKPDLPVVNKTCTELYDFAPSFVHCSETPTECRFYTNTSQQSCTQICAKGGGTCVSACEESGPGYCNCSYSEPCGAAAYDQICTCTRP